MSIDANCPACQKRFRKVRQELLGRKAQCPCGHTFVLVSAASAESDQPASTSEASQSSNESDSVDLSSAAVFENSYGDLDAILAGQGSTAPLARAAVELTGAVEPESSRATDSGSSSVHSGKTPASSKRGRSPSDNGVAAYGPRGKSVGFLAALVSGSVGLWASWFVLQSRFRADHQPVTGPLSQAFRSINSGLLEDLAISVSLERTFVALGWVIFAMAACLLVLCSGQLINAGTQVFWRKRWLPAVDGLSALTASILLFLILSALFFHSSHMSQLTRELNQQGVGLRGADTVLARNLQQIQTTYDQVSRQFVVSILVAATAPLLVCLTSLTRVYVTLGEGESEAAKERSR